MESHAGRLVAGFYENFKSRPPLRHQPRGTGSPFAKSRDVVSHTGASPRGVCTTRIRSEPQPEGAVMPTNHPADNRGRPGAQRP
jgi:hypothetical protein